MKTCHSLLILIAAMIFASLANSHSAVAVSTPNLSIQTTLSPTYQLNPSSKIRYTIDYWNEGDTEVEGIVIRASLPAQFLQPVATFDSLSVVADQHDSLTWHVASLGAKTHGQIFVDGIISAEPVTRTIQLSATATIESEQESSEPNSADNSHTTIAWLAQPLQLTIAPSQSTPTISDTVSFLGTWEGQKTGCTQTDIHLTYTPSVVGEYSSIAIGRDGLPIISFHSSIEGSLLVTHCNDHSCSKGKTTIVDHSDSFNEGSGQYTSIAIGRDNLPIISYYTAESDDLRVAHCEDTQCAAATVTTLDQTGFVGLYTDIAIGTDGLPLISYYDQTNQSLKLANCLNLACTAAEIKTIASADSIGTHNGLTIGRDGFPLISYYNASQSSLQLVHCKDRNCSELSLQTIDDSADVGLFSSVAIKSDGFPIISYYDHTNKDLKVASCSDFSCTRPDVQKLDSYGDVGRYSSIAIGADGLPVISYFDNDHDNLRLAHCQTANCSQAILTTLDANQSVGQHNDLAVGNDGLPIISYHESGSGGNLRVAHCQPTLDGLIDYGDGTIKPISTNDGTFFSQHSYNVVGNFHAVVTTQGQTQTLPLMVVGELSDLGGLYGKAWHRPGSLQLGPLRTLEAVEYAIDGDQGDDGVRFQLAALLPSEEITMTVIVVGTANQTPTLSVWFDWNSDGQFNAEELAVDAPVGVGVNKLFAAVPADFNDHDTLMVRARLYEERSPLALPSPIGLGLGGEVEDYILSNPTAIQLAQTTIEIRGTHLMVIISSAVFMLMTVVLIRFPYSYSINSRLCKKRSRQTAKNNL